MEARTGRSLLECDLSDKLIGENEFGHMLIVDSGYNVIRDMKN